MIMAEEGQIRSGKTSGPNKKNQSKSNSKSKKKRRNWSHDETCGLIAIWAKEEHQAGFEGMKYNSRVWATITNEFLEKFPTCPFKKWEQMKERIEYLRKKYRQAKKENNLSGRGRNTSPFYSELDEILGRRPMNNVQAHHHLDAGLSSEDDDDEPAATGMTAPLPGDNLRQHDAHNSSTSTGQDGTSDDSDIDMLDMEDLGSPEPPPPSDDGTTEEAEEAALAEKDIPGPSSGTKRKQDIHEGYVQRKRRGKRSQIEEAMEKAMTKLVECQEKQHSESTGALLQLERDRFAWEQKQEEERQRRESQWRRDQLDLEDRRMQNNSQILMQFLSVFGKMGQSGNQSYINQPPARQPNAQPAVSPIPPYVDHTSFGDETAPTFWHDTHRM